MQQGPARGEAPNEAGRHDEAARVARAGMRLLRSLRPDVKAAAFVFPAILVMALAEVMSAGIAIVVIGPIRVVIYVVQGYLVARFASQDERFRSRDLLRLGVFSALISWTMGLAWAGLSLVLVGAMTAGVMLVAFPVNLAIHLGAIIFNMIFTPAAALIADRWGGRRLAAGLVALGCLGMVVVAVLIAAAVVLVGWAGMSLLR